MELKRHASYWMNWKRWEHLNGRDRDGEVTIKNFDFDAYRLLVFTGFEQLKSKSNKTNNNNTNLIISILSYQEVRKHHYGLDTMDFNDNVRKDFNYG